jgi:hypothetical protein
MYVACCRERERERTPGPGADDERNVISVSPRDFAKRFERGKLGFTGDVLQVISVFAVSKSLVNY